MTDPVVIASSFKVVAPRDATTDIAGRTVTPYFQVDASGAYVNGSLLSGSGSWQYNVKTYGATGDGTTDDAANIQTAVNAVIAAGGGTLFFPAGTYKVSTEILVNGNNVTFVGEGCSKSIISASSNSVGTCKFGSLSISSSGKSTDCGVYNMGFQATSGSTAVNFTAYGTTRFFIERCDFYRGATAFRMRNCDMWLLLHNKYRITAASAICMELIQGTSDDVTTGGVLGGITDINGTSGIGVLFNDGSGGSPNEFNNIHFGASFKIDGNNVSGTTGIKMIAGVRNTLFHNLEIKECRAYSIDSASALLGGQKCFYTIDNCKILGNSTNKPTAHIYAYQSATAGSRTEIEIRGAGAQLHVCTNAIYIESGSPAILIRNADASTATNFLEMTAGATPFFGLGMIKVGGSVTNRRGATLAAGSATYEALDGASNGDFLIDVTGTATINTGATTAVVSSTFDFTPASRDVQLVRNSSAGGDIGDIWVTNVSATGFTVNCRTAPSGANATFQWRVKAV